MKKCFLCSISIVTTILPKDPFKPNVRICDHRVTHIYRNCAEQLDNQKAPSSINVACLGNPQGGSYTGYFKR
jgi:hypothetical protein